jgi:hypothetical protein
LKDVARDEEPEHASPREALIIAAIVVIVFRLFVPFGGTILYPFTLFATWVHEMGHGLAAIAVGGSFSKLEIFWNASGLASTTTGAGWQRAVVCAAGLLAPPILGTSILTFARGPKRASIVLWILSAVMLASVPIWVRSFTGFIVVPLVAIALAALAWKGGPTMRTIGAQFLGLLLALDTIGGIDYLFTGYATVDGQRRPSDVASIAEAIGLHWLVWGILIAIVSLALVLLGIRLAWSKPWRLPRRVPTKPSAAQ